MKDKPCSPFTLNNTFFVDPLQLIRRTISVFYSTSSIPCRNGAILKKLAGIEIDLMPTFQLVTKSNHYRFTPKNLRPLHLLSIVGPKGFEQM
jgi:hypothetical protein